MNRKDEKQQSDLGRRCGNSLLQIPAPSDFVEFTKDAIELSVAALFEQQVQLHADHLAVKAQDQALTYSKLNRAANRVAHEILSKHPWRPLDGPDSNDLSYWEAHAEPVAVFMGQGVDAVAAAIGLLKAGKIFLPIDSADPHTRVSFILRHAPACVIVTNNENVGLAEKLAPPDCDVINIDLIREGFEDQNPNLPVSPLSPAYLIYTSGSTGQPKGVIHSQRNLLHDLMIKTNLIRLSSSDHVSMLSWATGQATKLIFTALLNGGSLHLFNLKREGLAHLAAWMMRERITVNTISAPICRSFLELLKEDEEFPDLRVIRTASDAVYPEDIARMKNHFGSQCFFLNALASTETGIVCAQVMNKSTPIEMSKVPIGYPVDDTEIHLLDENGKRTGANGTGSIAITSRYIARGYWRRPDLTRDFFSPDPDDPEVLKFRSADLARVRPDGSLELLGRSDFRVKIRGYQVEPAEVEATLMEHDNVVEAVVQACESWQGEKRLIGYVVPRTRPAPTTSALHRFLRKRVAEYMNPAAFVVMDAIPLLPTGKKNRRALPAPGRTRAVLDNEYFAPRTPIEESLVDIWSQVIGIEPVGIHDHFMELGGDSLRAGQVMARVMDAYGVDLPIQLLFESPTVTQIAAVIEQQQTDASGDRKSIVRRPGKGPWELSFGQKRMWFLNQLNPDSTAYNMPKLIQLAGELNVAALSEALDLIVARHEVLRTDYLSREGQPDAVVADSTEVELPLIDLSGLPEGDREAELHRLIVAESLRPFDLAHGLKLHCSFYRFSADEHMLLCVTHHIVSDGWSRGVLMRELVAHYEAFVAGEPPPLKALPLQYSDFAHWQAQQQNSDSIHSQLDYWTECLRDIPSSLNLPTDRPRPAIQSSRGSSYLFTIPWSRSRALSQLARREEVTLFMLLLATFNVLLYRYTGQEDVVIGCPVAGRSTVDTEDLIGFFVNTLVMRNDLSGNPTFREMLGRVREQALGAYANPDVPFEKLVDHLQPQRDLSRNPLFQVMFDVYRPKTPELQTPDLNFRMMDVQRQTTLFDQTWNIAVTDEGLRTRIEYSTDLFDESTIERMMAHYQCLLEGIVANPEACIYELPLLDEAERRYLLVESNDTRTDHSDQQTINELFEAQVERNPAAVAVVDQDEELSYSELNARANQLAHYLRELGVGPEDLVGVCIERSVEMVVALLGILKAGGAYVPLDPSYPKDRLTFMLEDTRVSVLLTQSKLLDQLPARGTTVVCVDADAPRIDSCRAESPFVEARAEGLAYVIYTSGSTGQPKGVQISHRSVTNFLSSMQREPGMVARDTLLAVTTLSFDIAVLELFLPLMVGARVVIASREDALDGERLLRLLSSEGVSVMQATPTTWRLLLGAGWRGTQGLKILSGGEALGRDLAKELVGRGASVWNLYGPTETTVWSTCYRVSDAESPILVGRPIANTRVYVLDLQGQPVPIGVAGELYIGGEGVACGYLNRPQLNAERFVPDSFSGDPAARLYRTGDLVRFRADANLEYLNRVDHQVKLRGFRIELGEIEAVLAEHEAVDRAVVELREDAVGDRRLVAYVVASTQHHGSEGGDRNLIPQLRAHLRGKLPAYMVPANFVRLDALPLTPNKKVDRRALPAPDENRPELEGGFVAPRTPIEVMLAGVWGEVLGIENVGIYDNFFELGGHSLLATQIISRIKMACSVDLPIRALFDSPTVAELAQCLPITLDTSDQQTPGTGSSMHCDGD